MSKPLTIDELKALPVGEWVWLIRLDMKNGGGYTQIGDPNICIWQTDVFRNYGTKWLAYKNKEQSENDNCIDIEQVRKDTTKKVLQDMLRKMYKLTGCGVPYHVKAFIQEIAEENGVDIEVNNEH